MPAKNSISEMVADFVRIEGNYASILETLSNLVATDNDNITISVVNQDGSTSEYEVPSVMYIKSEIDRLAGNLDALVGNTSAASVKLPDGTWSKLYSYEVPNYPKSIINDRVPLVYSTVNTDVASRLIDPNILVTIDLSGKGLTVNNRLVKLLKIDVVADDQTDADFLNSNVVGESLSYGVLLERLNAGSIPYVESEINETVDPRISNKYGNFDVLDFTRKAVTITDGDGNQSTVNRYVYQLNTLKYLSDGADVYVSVGDNLVLNNKSGAPNTSFVVDYVNIKTNEIGVKNKLGFGSISRGTDILSVGPSTDINSIITTTISPGTYTSIFIKLINEASNIISPDWGEAVMFYTGSLTHQLSGEPLDTYATNNNITGIVAAGEQYSVPISYGIKPNAPTISADLFRVVEINTHKKQRSEQRIAELLGRQKNLGSEAASIRSQISSNQKKLIVSSGLKVTGLSNTINVDKAKLASAIEELDSVTNELNEAVNSQPSYTPKYRIRGFWSIPQPKYVDPVNQVGAQHIAGFIYSYRYLKTDNTLGETDQFTITDSDGNKTQANYSKWVDVVSPIRKRTLNESNQLVWTTENVGDTETVNINQLDIPISPMESVEIRIKSLSEVGMPSAPIESEWSDSVIIQFPAELDTQDGNINTQAASGTADSQFLSNMQTYGLSEHISESVDIDGRYYTHHAGSIATSIKTPEQKPIDVDTELLSLRERIQILEAQLTGEVGQPRVSVLDASGNVLSIVNNDEVVDIFAGYYTDEVESLPIPKGEIVSKTYYILIENLSAAELQLLGYVPGSIESKVPSNSNYEGYLSNIYEYFNYRKYWLAPISLKLSSDAAGVLDHHTDNDYPFKQLSAYQSSQVQSQFIYARYRDVSLNTKLYDVPNNQADHILSILSSGPATNYVWDKTQTSTGSDPNGDGNLSNFCVHVDHPFLQDGSYFMQSFADLFNINNVPNINIDTNEGDIVYPAFYHSKYFNKPATDPEGKLQLGYYQYAKGAGGTLDFSNFPRKLSFTAEDKYLIGSNTVGSYLFMGANNHRSLYTGTNSYNKGYVLKNGDNYSLRVPVTFQYRMTDYNGEGSDGIGTIGGYGSGARNLTYTKQIGLDVLFSDAGLFSFDIRVTAKYQPSNLSNTKVLIR